MVIVCPNWKLLVALDAAAGCPKEKGAAGVAGGWPKENTDDDTGVADCPNANALEDGAAEDWPNVKGAGG